MVIGYVAICYVVLTKIVPDDLKYVVNSLMALSKQKKKLRAASHARWNIANVKLKSANVL